MTLRARRIRQVFVYFVVFILLASILLLARREYPQERHTINHMLTFDDPVKNHSIHLYKPEQVGKGIVLAKVVDEDAQWVKEFAET